jgi:hypothetical protein
MAEMQAEAAKSSADDANVKDMEDKLAKEKEAFERQLKE